MGKQWNRITNPGDKLVSVPKQHLKANISLLQQRIVFHSVATSIVPTIAAHVLGESQKRNNWEGGYVVNQRIREQKKERTRGPKDPRTKLIREGYKTPKSFIQLSRKSRIFPGNQHHGLIFTRKNLIFDHFHFWDVAETPITLKHTSMETTGGSLVPAPNSIARVPSLHLLLGHHLSMKHVSNVEYWICLCFLQYTCIYIYMCVYVYTYIYIYVCICKYIYIFTCLFSLLLHSATPCARYSQLRSTTIFMEDANLLH